MARSLKERADEAASSGYRELEPGVLRIVRGRLFAGGARLDRSDLEEAYNQAWHSICLHIEHGEDIANLRALLIDVAYKRALDIHRQTREATLDAETDLDELSVDGRIVEQVDDTLKLQALFRRLKSRLTERERTAVALCVIHGFSRREAAKLLGIREAACEKLMNRAMRRIGAVAASVQARGCGDEEWARALRAYALGGVAEASRDRQRVREHLDSCHSCRRYVMCLRGLAAVLPAPVGPLLRATGADHPHALVAWLRATSARNARGALHGGTRTGSLARIASRASGGLMRVPVGGGLSKLAGVLAVLVLGGGGVAALQSAGSPPHHRQPIRRLARASILATLPQHNQRARPISVVNSKPRRRSRPSHHRRSSSTGGSSGQTGISPLPASAPASGRPAASAEAVRSAPVERSGQAGDFSFEPVRR